MAKTGGDEIDSLRTIWNGLDWSVLTDMLLSVMPALICVTLHELSHGFTAYKLGDNTAKNMGRLTLNPLKHIDVMGFIMMVVFRFGWAKPVPVDMRNFRNPKQGMAITALAGPVSNILIAVIFLFAYGLFLIPLTGLGKTGDYICAVLYLTAYISIRLAVFNMLPIPPLDGSKVLAAIMPDEKYWKLMRYERYGVIALLALILLMNRSKIDPLGTAGDWAFGILLNIARWGLSLAYKLM